MGKSAGLTQAYELRDFTAEAVRNLRALPAVTLEEQLARAKTLQALGVTWRDAVDRIRIMRGRPLPGSLRPQAKATKRQRAASLSATVLPEPEPTK